MLNDFKEFIARGNVLDLAIAVVIGAAFGKIITTMVDGVLMPIIGVFSGGINFADKCINLSDKPITSCTQAVADGVAVVQYGQFITDIIQFLIVAFVVFLIARWAVKLFKGLETPAAGPTAEETLLAEIRDILKDKK
jgi:large conductance mechanosensitive channel